MLTNTAAQESTKDTATESPDPPPRFLGRRVWLPRLLYDSLPYFYLIAGFSAFFATLYINYWFWVVPHYVLFSAACVHLGIVIYGRRRAAANDTTREKSAS